MSQKEEARLVVLNKVFERELSLREACGIVGVSERHGWRLLAAYRRKGAAALAHGNRGRQPGHTIPADLRARVQELVRGRYDGVNHTHLTELLAEQEGIALSRSTVRRILLQSGMKSPKTRRPPKHRSRRERYPQRGMLLQIDGSHHEWLEGRGPKLCLIAATDDATGEVPYALFRPEEDTRGYFELMEHIVATHGIPLAVYRDRHRIFETPPRHQESLEEQLADKRELTQFGRLLSELGIESKPSHSPQARGRIERLWGTFQSRLVSEIRLAGAQDMDQANEVLAAYLQRHNHRFMVLAAQPGSAYRPTSEGFIPREVFCLKHRRTVGADNVVRFKGHRLQIQPGITRPSYARAKVTVHEGFDGDLAVYYQGQRLTTTKAPPDAGQLRSSKPPADFLVKRFLRSRGHKPAPNHPWRRSYKALK